MQAAGPADEPVENSSIFHGFLVLPPNQMSSYARDPETSFATRTAPADFNLYIARSTIKKYVKMNLARGKNVSPCKLSLSIVKTKYMKISEG